jgi:hypothetical protein
MNQKAVFLTACRPSATVADECRFQALLALCFGDTSEIFWMVVCYWGIAHSFRADGTGGRARLA